ncbi:MAG: hypothetical protein H7A25_16380 [Leptospiraceae bacterium]|nr:hypothetical protein [Leptospiraceae bacterium]MCP5501480.1 hypothetical protein [Leptospiraceae bacterium]
MNKFFFGILFFIMLLSGIEALPLQPVAGMWEGMDKNGKKVAFLFEENGYLTIISGEYIAGGQNFVSSGERSSIRYSFNFDEKPNTMDMELKKGKKKSMVRAIVKLIDPNRLLIYSKGVAKKRPEKFGFNDPNNLLILFRKK